MVLDVAYGIAAGDLWRGSPVEDAGSLRRFRPAVAAILARA